MAGHMFNPSTKFDDPAPNCSVMISDNSHYDTIDNALQPLRMRRVT